MGYPLETSFDTSGDNIQRRELYSMDEFAETEPPGSTNWMLYKCWKSLSLGGRVPLAQAWSSRRTPPGRSAASR